MHASRTHSHSHFFLNTSMSKQCVSPCVKSTCKQTPGMICMTLAAADCVSSWWNRWRYLLKDRHWMPSTDAQSLWHHITHHFQGSHPVQMHLLSITAAFCLFYFICEPCMLHFLLQQGIRWGQAKPCLPLLSCLVVCQNLCEATCRKAFPTPPTPEFSLPWPPKLQVLLAGGTSPLSPESQANQTRKPPPSAGQPPSPVLSTTTFMSCCHDGRTPKHLLIAA